MRPATRSLAPATVLTSILSALRAPLVLFLAASSATASPGKWATSADSSNGDPLRYAVHMALLRGDGSPYHSRILWFRGQETAFHGAEWGWLTGNDGCNSFPGPSFVRLTPNNPGTNMPTAPGMDIFCAGHTGLADGRLFVPGGTSPQSGYYGERQTRIFTRWHTSKCGAEAIRGDASVDDQDAPTGRSCGVTETQEIHPRAGGLQRLEEDVVPARRQRSRLVRDHPSSGEVEQLETHFAGRGEIEPSIKQIAAGVGDPELHDARG